MEAKTKKIIIWTCVGVLVAAGIGVGAYFIIKEMNKPKPQPSTDGYATPIVQQTESTSKARIIQYDVGQADCALVQVSKDDKFETKQDNFNILVDVGVENGAKNEVKKALCDKIYNDFVSNIDLIVFSHMHFDHIAAASTLLNDSRFTFTNTVALFNWAELRYTAANSSKGLTTTTKTLIKNLEDKKIQLADSNYWAAQDAPNNRIVDFGNGNYFSVLGGTDVQIKNNPNAWSVVNRFNWNNQSVLYTGDLAGTLDKTSGVALDIPKKHYAELDCDILKAPHHGSATEDSNGLKFVQAVSPSKVLVSVGESDAYTLPDTTALKNYVTAGVKPENIWGTEKFGVFPERTLDQIKAELQTTNPDWTQDKIDKKAQAIFNGWAPLYQWLKDNPSANFNNHNGNGPDGQPLNGHGLDIKIDL